MKGYTINLNVIYFPEPIVMGMVSGFMGRDLVSFLRGPRNLGD